MLSKTRQTKGDTLELPGPSHQKLGRRGQGRGGEGRDVEMGVGTEGRGGGRGGRQEMNCREGGEGRRGRQGWE